MLTKPIPASTKDLLSHESIGYTARTNASFNRVKALNTAFGAIGLLASKVTEDDIAAPNHIADPSPAIAAAVAKELAANRGTRVLAEPISVSGDDPAHVAAGAKSYARFVVDVKTDGWGVGNLQTSLTRYAISYRGIAHLIDTQTNDIVAQDTCTASTLGNTNPPTYDELKNDNAALVKAVVSEMISVCTRRFVRKMLGADDRGDKPAIEKIGIPSTSPLHEPLRPLIATMPASSAERWSGVMACGPLSVTQPGSGPYQVIFDMEVSGSTVTIHRKSAHVVETLAGEVIHGQLKLQGDGFALSNPAKRWGFEMQGSFDAGSPTYTAKGYRIANGKRTRDCELRMMRISMQ